MRSGTSSCKIGEAQRGRQKQRAMLLQGIMKSVRLDKIGDKDKVLQKIKIKSYAATRDNEKCQVR